MKRHEILFFPAWDRYDPDPSKNYGVSCLTMRFMVHGDRGAVEFQLDTQWYLPHVMERRLQAFKTDVLYRKEDYLLRTWINPFPCDICRYSPTRLSDDDTFFETGVSWVLEGKPCYYDYIRGDKKDLLYRALVRKGVDAVWKYLDVYYDSEFGKEE